MILEMNILEARLVNGPFKSNSDTELRHLNMKSVVNLFNFFDYCD